MDYLLISTDLINNAKNSDIVSGVGSDHSVVSLQLLCNESIRGITLSTCDIKIIQYADDTAFVTDGSRTSFKGVMNSLQAFHFLSGLKVNYDKTSVFSIGAKRHAKEVYGEV